MTRGKHDWGLVIAGIALAAAGFFCMLAPGLTIVTIAAIVGAFFLVAGVFDIIGYIRMRNLIPRSGWELAYAVIDVLLGLVFLLHPLAFSAVVPWLVGLCFAAFGVFEIVAAVKAHGWGVPLWGVAPVQRHPERAVRRGVLPIAGNAEHLLGRHPAGSRRKSHRVRLERRTLYAGVACAAGARGRRAAQRALCGWLVNARRCWRRLTDGACGRGARAPADD